MRVPATRDSDALIRCPLAGDQLHEGRLAGAVAADDAPSLAALDLEGDAGEERIGAEDDGEVAC